MVFDKKKYANQCFNAVFLFTMHKHFGKDVFQIFTPILGCFSGKGGEFGHHRFYSNKHFHFDF